MSHRRSEELVAELRDSWKLTLDKHLLRLQSWVIELLEQRLEDVRD